MTLDILQEFLNEKLQETDMFVVEILIKPGNRIYIFLDSFSQVVIADCVRISRLINQQFDREVEDYSLEVSSAGLTSSFKVEKQYLKNLGKKVKLKTTEGLVIKGVLTEYNEKTVIVNEASKEKGKITTTEHKIEIKNISQIKLDISFF